MVAELQHHRTTEGLPSAVGVKAAVAVLAVPAARWSRLRGGSFTCRTGLGVGAVRMHAEQTVEETADASRSRSSPSSISPSGA